MRCGIVVVVVALALPAASQERGEKAVPLTGNIQVDLFLEGGHAPGGGVGLQGDLEPLWSKKSPWLAAGMSAVVPGSGEFYSGSYVKSALFFAVEVGAWVLAYHFDKKGDRQTDFFQGYADQHWSVVQYAHYSIDNLVDPTRRAYYNTAVFQGDPTAWPPWQQVNWNALNQMEREIGGFYSHTLPAYGEQQYYELIGKYPQFVSGWDAVAGPNALPPDYDQIKAHLPQQFLYYSEERGKANDYYASATTFVMVALVNHVVSTLDAAWSASRSNRAHAEVGFQNLPGPYGWVPVPMLKTRLYF
jgi:hypothetical protein